MLHRNDAPLAVAAAARHLFAVFPQPAAVAIRARGQAVVHHFLGNAGSSLFQRDAQADAHVAAVLAHLPPLGAGTAEEGGEDVPHAAETAAEQVLEIHVAAAVATDAGAGGRAGNGAEAVVLGPLLSIGQHIIGFVQLFELVFRVGGLVHVGVQLACLMAKRFLDVRFRGVPVHAEHFVQIFSHGARNLLSLLLRLSLTDR